MCNSNPNPLLYLIADDASGRWSGVITSWCEATGYPTLTFTADPGQATAFLIVAHSAAWVLKVLASDPALDPYKPLVWINAFTGALFQAESPTALRQLIESQQHSDTEWPPHTLPVPTFRSLFRPVPDHKLQGGFLEGGEFEDNRAYALELSVVFLLGPDGLVWACLGPLADLPPRS